jgi:hypothetical protein
MLVVFTIKYRVPILTNNLPRRLFFFIEHLKKIEYLAQENLVPQFADSTIKHVLEKHKKINIINTWIM